MAGFITEQNLEEAEQTFPGITRFFASLSPKPRTFLDLVRLFEHWCEPPDEARAPAAA
jgi:hypothetical protein